MSITDEQLDDALNKLAVPAKSSGLEARIIATANSSPVVNKPSWREFFFSLFAEPQMAMAYSVVLCFGLTLGWYLPDEIQGGTKLSMQAVTVMQETDQEFSFLNVDDVISVDGFYKGGVF